MHPSTTPWKQGVEKECLGNELVKDCIYVSVARLRGIIINYVAVAH